MDPDEVDALADLTDEDRHLANACLDVEAWSLPREVRLVKRLLAADMFGEKEIEAAIERGEFG